ncbi:hypothetical protein HYV43_02275 [Candidatus Micrarchaeota archaeon]|nr:hypothetical protein [Candidatus Micrarchaeota archaeon]
MKAHSKFAINLQPLVELAVQCDKRLLAVWALECAERVLPVFEGAHPTDLRPRMALETLRAWSRGECNVTPARKIALQAHAAARESKGKARFAARAAGQAVSVAHAKMHAVGAAYYAAHVFSGEQMWQLERLRDLMRRAVSCNNPCTCPTK